MSLNDILSILLVVLFFLETILYINYWTKAMSNTKKSDRPPLAFFNWGLMFSPEYFTDTGNVYRKKTLIVFVVMIFTILIMFKNTMWVV